MRFSLALPLTLVLLASVAQAQPADSLVTLNGVRLYVRLAGTPVAGQPPTVFLHGGPGYNSHSFAVQVGQRLETHGPMVYLDQRGCGRSERPAAYSMKLLVEDLEALRQHLGVEQIVPMGHSFGGAVALEYAARYPERVARLVLVAPLSDTPASTDSWRAALRRWHPALAARADSTGDLWSAISEAGGQRFFDRMQFRDQSLRVRQDSIDTASGLANTGELSNALWQQGLAGYRFSAFDRITMPVLLIGGVEDYAIGLASTDTLAKHLPHVAYHRYDASAHFPYVEEPARFVADVASFLK